VAVKLADVLKGMSNGGVGATVKTCEFLSLWNKVVDERVGKQTEAVKIRNRVLYVVTRSPAWAQELSFLKGDIIKKFNAAAGAEVIQDIRFSAA
jgi:predicted nucleic acid-binding Zn ribbon protein